MSQAKTAAFLVELTEKNDPAPISARLRSFLEFSGKMSLELDELEGRFADLCTNHSLRVSLRGESTKS